MAMRGAANSAVKLATTASSVLSHHHHNNPTKSLIQSFLYHTKPIPKSIEREVIDAKAHYDRTGRAFVKEYRSSDVENLQQVSSEKETLMSEESMFFVHRPRRHCQCVISKFPLPHCEFSGCQYPIIHGEPFLIPLDSKFSPKTDIWPSFPSLNSWPSFSTDYGFCSSSNGLSCFHRREDSKIYVWHPAAKELKILPDPPSMLEVGSHLGVVHAINSCQIWFDPKSEDYKVLRIGYTSYYGGEFCKSAVELYSLKTDSWKKISSSPDYYFSCHFNGVCINGVYYTMYVTERGFEYVLCFDFATETVSSVLKPDIHDIPHTSSSLVDYKGVLGIILTDANPCRSKAIQIVFYQLWVLRDNSDECRPRWEVVSDYHASGVWKPLAFSRNGEFLFWERYDREGCEVLLVFDSTTGKLKRVHGGDSTTGKLKRVHGGHGGDSSNLRLIPFSESSARLL